MKRVIINILLLLAGVAGLIALYLHLTDLKVLAKKHGTIQHRSLNNPVVKLDDKRVLLVGSYVRGASNARGTLEIYDIETHQSKVMNTFADTPKGYTATRLKDGSVLILGNNSETGQDLSIIYDPAHNQIIDIPPLNIPRIDHTATLLDDGKVLIVGGRPGHGLAHVGHDISEIELFDPKTRLSRVVNRLINPKSAHSAEKLPNNNVVILGGTKTRAVEIYNPEKNTSELAGELMSSHYKASSLVLSDGRILVVGDHPTDYPLSNSIEIYDPIRRQSKIVDTEHDCARMFKPGLVLLPEGNVLMMGSENCRSGRYVPKYRDYSTGTPYFNFVDRLNPETGEITRIGRLDSYSSYISPIIIKDKIYLFRENKVEVMNMSEVE